MSCLKDILPICFNARHNNCIEERMSLCGVDLGFFIFSTVEFGNKGCRRAKILS